MAKSLNGVVTSDKSDKTIVITVTERKTHPLYKKQYTVKTKYMAHDESNDAKNGDLVMIAETRPISARKHFKLAKIIERGGVKFKDSDATADIPVEPKAESQKPETITAKPSALSSKTPTEPAKEGDL